ncbi:CYTH domain-containing protein [Methylosoma difficile]
MAIEVEHKFLLANDAWREHVSQSVRYRQGYLSALPTTSIRVRTSQDQAWLNIKSAVIGTQRHEYEYEIPLQDADEMISNLCQRPLIEKIRHFVEHGGHLWEIDEFEGDNAGLIVAEIELSEEGEVFQRPEWLGQEVTEDLRYYNNNLVRYPYSQWRDGQ